jgi:hypothetical protein
MEFRLVYRGSLPSESSRDPNQQNNPRMLEAKRKIRSFLRPQIEKFWKSHPAMNYMGSPFNAAYGPQGLSFWEHYSNHHQVVTVSRHIHKFAPLITDYNYNGCSVNVLFMRRDAGNAGALMQYGDLDNRIKVLFDALRKPKGTQEIEDLPQPPEENPCFCLLEDDRYIDHVSVTTDRLLVPVGTGESESDVFIVIHVIARVVNDERSFSPIR